MSLKVFEQFQNEFEQPSVRAQRAPWWGGIQLAAYGRQANKLVVMTNATMEVLEEGTDVQPFIELSEQRAQRLMEDLWNCGLRPSQGIGSIGQLGATEKHLSDMRSLVKHYTGSNLEFT